MCNIGEIILNSKETKEASSEQICPNATTISNTNSARNGLIFYLSLRGKRQANIRLSLKKIALDFSQTQQRLFRKISTNVN